MTTPYRPPPPPQPPPVPWWRRAMRYDGAGIDDLRSLARALALLPLDALQQLAWWRAVAGGRWHRWTEGWSCGTWWAACPTPAGLPCDCARRGFIHVDATEDYTGAEVD